jgi:hypothetical protein
LIFGDFIDVKAKSNEFVIVDYAIANIQNFGLIKITDKLMRTLIKI